EDRLSPICNRSGDVIGAVVVFHDVSHARQMANQLSWQAAHDALTGLANRREFERLLQELIDSAAVDGKHHAVLFMDLDQFKVVNDTCGHMAGDELLRQLVAVFVARGRDSDTVARLGGDEFGMLLYGCPLEPALRLANEVREGVQQFRFMWQDKSFEVGISIGLVEINSTSGNLATVMSNADAACYAAKDGGRNRVHVYLENDTDLARRHGEMQWISRISKAFEEDRFRLYYQEIAAVMPHQRGLQHFEVLLRMVDENGEVISPVAFIPAAERYNLMPTVDRWVIRTLFSSRSGEWRRMWEACQAREEPFPILCAVNLSATSLNDEMFSAFLKEQLEYYGMPPQALCLEITETSAIANLNKASRFMHELSKLGCSFALDDFGSGMSSFAYLKDLPVHYLKIDGAFVRGMDQNPVNLAMVEAIARIASVMGIETVAEFVEDKALIEKLAVLGVDYAQGYGIHVPAPMEEIHYGSARA
ncbi:MAG: EAL domain-containing protein, partial [Sulfurimicrobium sp.]|nr:EAL domain-containing protein [Sulfurimicrobium sp.]